MRKEGRAFFDVERQKKMEAARNVQKIAQQQPDVLNNNSQQTSEKIPSVCARAMQGM
jgi:hypothetical protein